MATLYSATLYSGLNEGTGTYNSVAVPTGFVWVVRDIVLQAPLRSVVYPQFAWSIQIEDGGGLPLFAVPLWVAVAGVTYHWSGHQVINTGDNLRSVVQGPGWSWRISGFKLTTP